MPTIKGPDKFRIDDKTYHIMLSDLKFTFSLDGTGLLRYTVTCHQYNHTHAIGTPNNAAVHIDLLDDAGGVIAGDQITIYPRHDGCLGQPDYPMRGEAANYPTNVETVAVAINLRAEEVTYDIGPC